MAVGTDIGWTHIPGYEPATWNPTMGCTRRSEGCGLIRWLADRHGSCFAIHSVVRQKNLPGRDGLVARREDGELDWTGKIATLAERLRDPLKWTVQHAVFINSLGELLDDQVDDAYVAAAWCTMFWTSAEGRRISGSNRPVHIYMLLTKLAARLRRFMRLWADVDKRVELIREAVEQGWCTAEDLAHAREMPVALDNLWLGVSVENQKWADTRLSILAEIPAVVRFASCEPLIGPIDLSKWLADGTLQWVIIGGESDKDGKHARPMHPLWVAFLLAQCDEHGVAVFFKQWGAFTPDKPADAQLAERQRYLVLVNGRFARHVDLCTRVRADLDDMARGMLVDDKAHPRFMYNVGTKAAGHLFHGQQIYNWPQTRRTAVAVA